MGNWHLRAVAVLVCAALETVPAMAPAASNNPNLQAGQLCPFGPGKARWAVKTSLAQDQSPSKLATLGIDGLISAPDLQVDTATVSAAKLQTAHVQAGAAAATPFVAHLRWGSAQAANAAATPGPDFMVKLAPISPATVQRASGLAQATDPDEAPPAFIDTMLSAELDAVRIPQPVAIGTEQYHEGDLVTVTGFVLSSTCEHDDGDFHIDLGDKAGGGTCAVVEVPNPTYIGDANLRAAVTKAQATAHTLAVGDRITVSGQLFYDATHTTQHDPGGGRGVRHCAKSLWEVHPVFNIVTG
jgi:hypothetical protein